MPGSSFSIAFVLVLLAAPLRAAGPPPESLSARDARAWLELPQTSTSLGRTNDGQLLNAVTLPAKGGSYVVLGAALGRKTNFGTSELIGLIERATRAVRERFPGSVLGIGNLGFESGTKIPWSVSHQAGRDADTGMYATTLDGAPIQAMPFHAFDATGQTTAEGGRRVRFDVPRNLAYVAALLGDPEARVQYIFVAAWLKEMLLAEARRTGLSGELVARMGEVLHQPTDSNPHADHFHIRLMCSVEDRRYGCINRGPTRAWIDPGDREHAAEARRIASIVTAPTLTGAKPREVQALKLRAIERLGAIAAASEIDALAEALADPTPKVRKAALAAIEQIDDARGAEAIVAILPRVADPGWATELFAVVPKLDADQLVPLAERVIAALGAPATQTLLHPKAYAKAAPKVLASALAVLRDHGSQTHVPLLIGLAEGTKDSGVRKAALEALAHRTCQALSDARAFRAWFDKASRAGDLAWAETGLASRKVPLSQGARSRSGVERLIAVVDHRDPVVRACAWRALTLVTGHVEDPTVRSPGRGKKHWQSWWRDHAAEVRFE